MQYTNKYNLPQPIVDLIVNDDYSRGASDISITGLLSPPRQTVLARQHAEELTEDVSDCLYRLYGKLVHKMLEDADRTALTEERYFMPVEGLPGKTWTISGQVDRLLVKDKTLQDYKFVSCWKFKNGTPPAEYIAQVNMYLELLRYNKIMLDDAEIHAMFRDFSKLEALRNSDYPPIDYMIYPVEIWPREKVQEFIKERVILHQQALEELPECTLDERWARATRYAVMKQGRMRAVKLYETVEAAEIHASKSSAFYVEHRPGVQTRCENYCLVAFKCSQYQNYLKNDKS